MQALLFVGIHIYMGTLAVMRVRLVRPLRSSPASSKPRCEHDPRRACAEKRSLSRAPAWWLRRARMMQVREGMVHFERAKAQRGKHAVVMLPSLQPGKEGKLVRVRRASSVIGHLGDHLPRRRKARGDRVAPVANDPASAQKGGARAGADDDEDGHDLQDLVRKCGLVRQLAPSGGRGSRR